MRVWSAVTKGAPAPSGGGCVCSRAAGQRRRAARTSSRLLKRGRQSSWNSRLLSPRSRPPGAIELASLRAPAPPPRCFRSGHRAIARFPPAGRFDGGGRRLGSLAAVDPSGGDSRTRDLRRRSIAYRRAPEESLPRGARGLLRGNARGRSEAAQPRTGSTTVTLSAARARR